MQHQPLASTQAREELQELLGAVFVTEASELARIAKDSSRYQPQGTVLGAVLARTTEDVATALAWAHRHRIPVSVRGAGSGVAGGAVGYSDGLVISLERCNTIRDIDPVNRLAVVEAGVITADLDRAVREHGLFFPPDPASVELSTVGGNIATNAGGLRCIAHGVTRDAAAAADAITKICVDHGAAEVSIAEDDSLLEARRLANPALSARGLRVSCDVGVPIGELANMFRGIAELSQHHGRAITIVAHAGDGNLHPTVEAEDTPAEHAAAERVLDDIGRLAVSLGGTITGEHGIGAVKHHELAIQLSQSVLDTQRAIKRALDPHDILTPGRAI